VEQRISKLSITPAQIKVGQFRQESALQLSISSELAVAEVGQVVIASVLAGAVEVLFQEVIP
jgi:hypothetical protein